MDTNEEERAKGKTVEVGRAAFDTPSKRYTVLDAPGHKAHVPNMIQGASQADVGILVISARKGEFETGFEKGGQTQEHAMLAKTLGVASLIVVVNKMDDETIAWDEGRYREIVSKLDPFLKSLGFKNVIFMPISGLNGDNLKVSVDAATCPWWKAGPASTLLGALDTLPSLKRDGAGSLRVPLLDRYRDRGAVVAMGKIERGSLVVGQKCVIMPTGKATEVLFLQADEQQVTRAPVGENVAVALKGVDEADIHAGFVLCAPDDRTPVVREFVAQIVIMKLHPHKQLFTRAYQCVFHCHAIAEQCEVVRLLAKIDKKTGKDAATKPQFVKSGDVVRAILRVEQPVCLEKFETLPQLGRFTLRDESLTIAIGKIMKLPKDDSTKGASK